MQRIEQKPANSLSESEAKRRRRSKLVQSFMLNFFTFGLAIVVIIASFRVSAPDEDGMDDSVVTHEQVLEGADLS